MHSHLDVINDWLKLARAAHYHVGELARASDSSRRQLERYFADRFGRAPQVWLDEVRLAEAANLLRAGRQVKDIAQRLGFKDCSHFCRKFKKHYGRTPLAFLGAEDLGNVAPRPEMSPKGH